MARILVVDDDAGIRRAFASLLRGCGHELLTAESGEVGIEVAAREQPDLILLDVRLPGMSGLDTFRTLKNTHSEAPVIMMTGSGTMDLAIEASRMGAYEYMLKPFEPGAMLGLIEQTLAARRGAEGQVAPAEAGPHESDLIIGRSVPMQELYRAIGRVAATDTTVLIRGESGTGKELVARAILNHSRRAAKPMIVVNCAAIAENLLESELFGHERGAFTGAVARHEGYFERAAGGTLLLDEIGEVPLGLQAKVLRVLQEKTFERIGGAETLRADVRILAATNRDLEKGMAEGRFREDLYHRLDGVTIRVPPLRDRREDIPALVRAFLDRCAQDMEVPRPAISEAAMAMLCEHDWPGNVRQLENCLRRAVLFGRGFSIQREDLQEALRQSAEPARAGEQASLEALIREVAIRHLDASAGPGCHLRLLDLTEREILAEALRRANGNQTRAAEILGIPRPTLHARLQRHRLRASTVVGDGDAAQS